MQKIIVDTNVLVSALIRKSYPYFIVYELLPEQRVQLCVSDAVLTEYSGVLQRPKFAKYPDFVLKAKTLLTAIELYAVRYVPQIKLELIGDKDDNKFLELADECDADYLITGNTNDFTFRAYKQTKVVMPKEYWENYRPK